jgi:small neutral amino acid transporter SnatA (MarC family)
MTIPDSLLKHCRQRPPCSQTFLIGLTLWLAAGIEQFLGKIGINIMTRVMAVIVAAIIMTDVRSEIPGLVSR